MTMSLSFKELLESEFKKYQEKNPRYSLRSFAKNLNLAPSTVHQYLNGKYPPTARNLCHIGKSLGWSEDLIQRLISEQKSDVRANSPEVGFKEISSFSLELLMDVQRIIEKQSEPVGRLQVQSLLNVPESQMDELNKAIAFLIDKSVLHVEQDRLSFVRPLRIVTEETPSGTFLEFQKKSLRRYDSALTEVKKKNRLSLMANLTVREEDLEKIGREMNRFAKSLRLKYGNTAQSKNYQMICGVIPFEGCSENQSEH